MKSIRVVKKDGRVESMDCSLGYLFSTLRNGTYIVTVKRATEKRTISQNDLLWLWMTCIEDETGTSKDDVYKYYCHKFLQRRITIGGKEVIINDTSSNLDTKEFTTFLDKIQEDAATELGIQLPQPQDKYFAMFYEEYR